MINISIFASGTGSNARKIVEYFLDNERIEVKLLVSNKKSAKVLDLAKEYDLSTLIIDKPYFYDTKNIIKIHRAEKIDVIVLAGFLWLIPPYLIEAYPDRILNIHPALLPKFGGKGMYGIHVHKAVKEANESESGPTIHIVSPEYDKGEIIFQDKCQILQEDGPEEIAKKVLTLEHQNYPKVIEKFIAERIISGD